MNQSDAQTSINLPPRIEPTVLVDFSFHSSAFATGPGAIFPAHHNVQVSWLAVGSTREKR